MIRGVFKCKKVSKVGTGTTTRRVVQTIHCYAEEDGDGNIVTRAIGANAVPCGKPVDVDRDEFLREYEPDLHYYMGKVLPRMMEESRRKEEHLAKGEQAREAKRFYSAEFEFVSALEIDEESVRGNFGLGLTYLERGEPDKATGIFDQVMTLRGSFGERHKHLFNEFGIGLRKAGLFDQAVSFYGKAAELCPGDENIFFNMARAYYEKGDSGKARENARMCLSMNGFHKAASKLMGMLTRAAGTAGETCLRI